MNCEQFSEVLQDLARNEWLDPATLKDAFEHVDACSACDDRLQDAEALTADLRSLAAVDASREASPRVEKALLERFAEDNAIVLPQSGLRLAAVAGLLSVAALALFAVLFIRHTRQAPAEGSRPAVPAANATDGREEASDTDTGANAPDALAAFESEDAGAGSFVPLTQTFDRTALDGGAVVRVVVPRTELQQFGLSAGQTSGSQVLADMVVASDGTPQAIRLVGNR